MSMPDSREKGLLKRGCWDELHETCQYNRDWTPQGPVRLTGCLPARLPAGLRLSSSALPRRRASVRLLHPTIC